MDYLFQLAGELAAKYTHLSESENLNDLDAVESSGTIKKMPNRPLQ